jgi:hypothetical protein
MLGSGEEVDVMNGLVRVWVGGNEVANAGKGRSCDDAVLYPLCFPAPHRPGVRLSVSRLRRVHRFSGFIKVILLPIATRGPRNAF